MEHESENQKENKISPQKEEPNPLKLFEDLGIPSEQHKRIVIGAGLCWVMFRALREGAF